MPQSNFIQPVWADCAFAAVETLRRHHGVPAPQCVDTAHKMEPLSELDELFARFDDGKEGEVLAESSGLPSRYVPARQLLTTIRLAATISGSGTYAQSRLCGALTVISDIEPKDMRCVKDILALAFRMRIGKSSRRISWMAVSQRMRRTALRSPLRTILTGSSRY